jgi:Ser-tRNA(Ala) deacylase AlaX
MTILRYLDDDATSGTAFVTALADGERPTVRLRETWFHPQGGGQPGDRGILGAMRVIDTRVALDGHVDHLVDQLIDVSVSDVCRFEIDAATRARNSRYHTAAHLLVGLAEQVVLSKQMHRSLGCAEIASGDASTLQIRQPIPLLQFVT